MKMENTSNPRRNVVVFMLDQLRRDYLHAYGCEGVPTPNIDKLSEQGVVYDRAIANAPACGPGWFTIMTGRYASDHQVWANDLPARDGLEYLPQRMTECGYLTGTFGKMHHWPTDDLRGFSISQLLDGRLNGLDDYTQWLRARRPDAQSWWNVEGFRWTLEPDEYYEHWTASRAIDFIHANARDSETKPFLAWLTFQGPHQPFDPPASVAGTCDIEKLPAVINFNPKAFDHPVIEARSARVSPGYKDLAELDRLRQAYAEMIVFIDQQIGRVINALEEAGVYGDTTIIVGTDHGDMLGDYSTEEKGPFPYRQCVEIPLVIANHPELDAGTRNSDLVGSMDIAGTILDIAGEEEFVGMSRSLLASNRPDASPPREVNFSEFNDSIKVVETHEFRCAYYSFTKDVFLYRPLEDPDLSKNLADDPEYAGVVREMLQHIIDFQLLAKGVGIEAHDLVWVQQHGLAAKDPQYASRMTVIFPLSIDEVRRTEAAGVDASFNETFRGREVISPYWLPYWDVLEEQ